MKLLLVEDNAAHADLITRALQSSDTNNKVEHVVDGEKALDYIYKRNGYESAVEPELILLDLRMPKVDGIEVLKTIKSDEDLRRIPVVILSTSSSPSDVVTAYDSYANCYLVKPSGYKELSRLLADVLRVWSEAS